MDFENQAEPTASADSAEITADNVDQVLADIAAGKEIGASATEQAPEATEQPWSGKEWEFDWNGKKIVPDSPDKIKTWMSQGYNYSQRMGELNKTHAQRMAEAEAKDRAAREIEQKYGRYAEVDQYAQENQDWWAHVQRSFQTREAQGVDPTIANVVAPLQEKLGALEQIIQSQQEAQAQAQLEAEYQREDQALDAEIDAIRKSHPNIDLSARDESGETLERRILAHCQEIQTKSFRAGFRDYLHDQLVVQSQANAKLQAVRGTQAAARAGVLGKSPAPTKELKPVDPRASWSDPSLSVQAALEEFRQINGG
jgi:hypothetical protein